MKTISNLKTLEEQVCAALESSDPNELRGLLYAQHPADLADVVDRLDDEDKLRVFRLLSPSLAAAVLSETSVTATRELLHQLSEAEARALFERMSPDDIVEILGEDMPDYQQQLLASMTPADANEARALLTFPPRSAGRLMTDQFVRVRPELTAAEALALLRQVGTNVEAITDLYALDNAQRLIGVVSLRNLLVAPPNCQLTNLLQPDIVSVAPETDQEEVARLVSQYDLLSLPVVAADRRMLGIITVDDVIDVLVQESTEDVLRLGAVQEGPVDENYFTVPIFRVIRRRVGWLLLLFLTGILTVNVLGFFENALAQVVALSFFIPLLIGTGGNTGAQTVSTMVRGMATGDIQRGDTLRVIWRELSSGLLLGLLLGVAALVAALLLNNPLDLALVVGFSVVIICTWSNTIGALVPILAQRLGLDPALVSAPLITTLVDATGLAIYLLIASLVLGL